jgi:peptide-methionine (S)-S-oxide reductase
MAQETIYLAGGCFWGVEELMRHKDGVITTRVGYMGGETENPTYEDICTGKTGHAETMEIVFDANIISLRQILSLFFQIHDPTTPNRQGNDIGTQYRSAIFYTTEEQKIICDKAINDLNTSGLWPAPATTTIEPAPKFWEAEDYHQDYLQNKPDGYNCHFPRPNWIWPET